MGQLLHNLWQKTAIRHADRVAVFSPETKAPTRFDQLQRRIEANLRKNRFTDWRNRVVVIQLPNSTSWLEAFLTCQAMEAIALPVEKDLPKRGLERLCERIRPCAVWNESGIFRQPDSTLRKPGCLIKLTSGSTGDPKPIFFGDEEMLADGLNIIRTMKITGDDRNLACIPFGHSYGLGNLILPFIIQGTALSPTDSPFPHAIAKAARESAATVFPAVPTLLNSIVRADIPASDLASIRLFISAGSPIAPADASAFNSRFGRRVHNFYGSSETGGIAYDRTGDDTLRGTATGTPLENVHTLVSASGRLLVSSKAVFTRHNPRRGDEMATFLLPDLAHQREDGAIVLRGRNARQIKIAGKRLNLAEVEGFIRTLDGVDDVFVGTYTDDRGRGGRDRLGALIVHVAPITRIKSGLKTLLPAWKIPNRWISLDKLPMTSRGKPDYRQLEQLLRTDPRSPDKP